MTWKRSEIRQARQTPLAPLLDTLGYRLKHISNGNHLVINLPAEVVVKDNYWVCADDGSAGNAIDFFVKLEGKSFTKTMEILTASV